MMNKFNFEDYWNPWETGSHWELKREFIEAYKNMFNEDRLLCLAQAYSNIILMNCRYPDPVMQQISELAKPLQKYKLLQEASSKIGMKRTINEEQIDLTYSEKNYSTCELSERSFKQIKFSIDEEQSTSAFSPPSTTMLQPSLEQCKNTYSVPLCQQGTQIVSKSEQAFKTPQPGIIKKPQPLFQIKDIFIEKDKENKIISALGLPFIKKFADKIKSCVNRFSIPIEIIQCVCYKLGIRNNFHFEIEMDPDSPSHATSYFSRFFIKDCEIACETSRYKKNSKVLCAEAAINTIVKLSTVDKVNSIKKCRPTFHRITNSMEVFEIFKRNIINRVKDEPAIITFKSIASLVDMERYIDFHVVSKNTMASAVTEYTCKFFLNDILISYATDDSVQSAKNIAAEFGLIKLSNLDEYEIHQSKLKKKLNPNNKSAYLASSYSNKKSCDIEINNSEKPFILNKVLFDSSKKDCLLLVERDTRKSNLQKDIRGLVSESAGFCRKKFSHEVEDAVGSIPPCKKVKVIIGGEVVGDGVAFSIDEGKTVACAKTYINFKKKYYTLRVKDKSFEGFLVTRDQVFDGEPYSKNVISKINLGCKTFRRKIKKDSKEKAKSNFVEAAVQQLLNSDMDSDSIKKHHNLHQFRQHIETMLKEFRESEDYCDLLFSVEFSQVEKVEILRVSKRLQLRAQFHEEADGVKFVCVKHKVEVPKLLDYLVKNNGRNCKFELIDDSETVI